VAYDIDAGSYHVDQGIDTEQHGEPFGGEAVGGEESGENDEIRAGNAGYSFAGDFEGGEQE